MIPAAYHIQNIIVTSPQFTRIVSHIVNANHDGPTRTGRRLGDQIKVRIDVNGVARGQLGNLRKSLGTQFLAHRFQDLGKTQIVFGNGFVLVQNVEKGRSAGTSRTSGRIGQGKGIDIGNIGRGLGIFATGNLCMDSLYFMNQIIEVDGRLDGLTRS